MKYAECWSCESRRSNWPKKSKKSSEFVNLDLGQNQMKKTKTNLYNMKTILSKRIFWMAKRFLKLWSRKNLRTIKSKWRSDVKIKSEKWKINISTRTISGNGKILLKFEHWKFVCVSIIIIPKFCWNIKSFNRTHLKNETINYP